MGYMYILECADGSFYTGSTKDLEKRLWEHQNGLGANHTKKRLPVKLVYYEAYDRIDDAFYREKQVQGWSRRKKLALIEGNREDLIKFSKNYTEYGPSASASTGSATASFPELVEGNTIAPAPAPASTGSASVPFPELVEGNTPASASTGSASAPFPELVEGNTIAPAPASTGSASVPFPELVEGNTTDVSTDNIIRKNLEGLVYEK